MGDIFDWVESSPQNCIILKIHSDVYYRDRRRSHFIGYLNRMSEQAVSAVMGVGGCGLSCGRLRLSCAKIMLEIQLAFISLVGFPLPC